MQTQAKQNIELYQDWRVKQSDNTGVMIQPRLMQDPKTLCSKSQGNHAAAVTPTQTQHAGAYTLQACSHRTPAYPSLLPDM
jgi:hypothetical protein